MQGRHAAYKGYGPARWTLVCRGPSGPRRRRRLRVESPLPSRNPTPYAPNSLLTTAFLRCLVPAGPGSGRVRAGFKRSFLSVNIERSKWYQVFFRISSFSQLYRRVSPWNLVPARPPFTLSKTWFPPQTPVPPSFLPPPRPLLVPGRYQLHLRTALISHTLRQYFFPIRWCTSSIVSKVPSTHPECLFRTLNTTRSARSPVTATRFFLIVSHP